MKPMILALAATLALSGCASFKLDAAARDKGKAAAGVTLPAWPSECRRNEPHAPLIKGGVIVSTLKRERAALDHANARSAACAGHYDSLKRKLEKRQ